jgi:hypothetical protein
MRQLDKEDVNEKESFRCPRCETWLRARRHPAERIFRYGTVIASAGVLFFGGARHIHWLAIAGGLGAVIFPIMEVVARQQHPLELDREKLESSAKPLG